MTSVIRKTEEKTKRIHGQNFTYFDSTDSTNARLIEIAHESECGHVCIAGEQTSGRGRAGRSFSSLPGKGLYLSYLYKNKELSPTILGDWLGITSWSAVAVCLAITDCCDASPRIKWVNDIYINEKKLCGILAQTVLDSSGAIDGIVIGIGINVKNDANDFGDALFGIATSLLLEGYEVEIEDLASALILRLDEMCQAFPAKKDLYLETYRRLCMVPGRTVMVIEGNNKRIAQAIGIDDNFGLIISCDGKEETLSSGEISIKI